MAENEGSADGAAQAAAAADASAGETAKVVEGRARRMGWRPKEEFRGDQSRWTDAQTFIDRGEAELPILRDRYRALDDRFVSQGAELREVKDRLSELGVSFKQFREFANKAEERAFNKAKREIETKMAAAVETADRPGFARAQAEMDELERTRPATPSPETKTETTKPAETTPTNLDPSIPRWVAENPWYNTDPELNAVATALHQNLLRTQPNLSMADNLAEVRSRIVKRYPERFDNPRREEPAAVAAPKGGSGAGQQKPKGKTYDDLPPDAKQAYEKFAKQIPNYTKDEYLKTYFAGDES